MLKVKDLADFINTYPECLEYTAFFRINIAHIEALNVLPNTNSWLHLQASIDDEKKILEFEISPDNKSALRYLYGQTQKGKN